MLFGRVWILSTVGDAPLQCGLHARSSMTQRAVSQSVSQVSQYVGMDRSKRSEADQIRGGGRFRRSGTR